MQVNIEKLREQESAELMRSSDAARSEVFTCVGYIVGPILIYLLVRDAVYRGVSKALKQQDADRLKSAEAAERAMQARQQAAIASKARTKT
jgi:hypothetical protein